MLTAEQIGFFKENGYLVVEDVPPNSFALRADVSSWVDESRAHNHERGEIG